MVDYAALKAELDKPAYFAMTDAQAAEALRTTQATSEDAISTAVVGRLWARRKVLATASARSTDNALTAAQRLSARWALTMVEFDGFADLDPRNPAQRTALVAFLDALVTDGVMTTSDRTATLALAVPTRTVAEAIGWPSVWPADVTAARKM